MPRLQQVHIEADLLLFTNCGENAYPHSSQRRSRSSKLLDQSTEHQSTSRAAWSQCVRSSIMSCLVHSARCCSHRGCRGARSVVGGHLLQKSERALRASLTSSGILSSSVDAGVPGVPGCSSQTDSSHELHVRDTSGGE